MSRSVPTALRLAHIAAVATAFGLVRAPRLIRPAVRREYDALLDAAGRLAADLAEALGPAALKVAQIASYRRDLLPAAFLAPLRRMQDEVRPPRPRAIRRALEAAYGGSLKDLFAVVEDRPLASGSVAVVLRARTVDGEEVALKLVRPGVAALIRTDLRWLRLLASLAARLPRFAGAPVLEMFDGCARLVEGQCDMELEAANAARLGALLGQEIVVPAPHLRLTRPTVLAMRFVAPTHGILDPQLPQARYEEACRRLLRALYRMLFVHGLVHCDLHPGNVGVAEDGRVVLYDFGLVAALSDEDRSRFRDFFLAVVRADAAAAAHHLVESAAWRPASFKDDAFRRDLADLLARRSGQRAGEFLVFGFVDDLLALQRRHGLHGTSGFTSAVWALGMFEGLVRARYPHLDFQAEARPFIITAMLDRARVANRA